MNAAAAVPMPAPAAMKQNWVVNGVDLIHKYTDPTEVEIIITNAGGAPVEPFTYQCLLLSFAMVGGAVVKTATGRKGSTF
jgi:hypothetical protein